MLLTVHAATAPVELITQPATFQFLNKNKTDNARFSEPLDDSNGGRVQPAARLIMRPSGTDVL